MTRALPTLLVVLCLGCGKEPLPPLQLAEGCQPLLAGADCMLPFPSDQFRVKDDSTPSGYRIELPLRARIRTAKGPADPSSLHPVDGFSRTSTIVAMFPSGVLAEGFVGLNADPSLSVADGSQSLIIDAETLERVPHFVDLDPRAKSPDRQALVLRAAASAFGAALVGAWIATQVSPERFRTLVPLLLTVVLTAPYVRMMLKQEREA